MLTKMQLIILNKSKSVVNKANYKKATKRHNNKTTITIFVFYFYLLRFTSTRLTKSNLVRIFYKIKKNNCTTFYFKSFKINQNNKYVIIV